MSADREAAIREALEHLVQQDRYEAPIAGKAHKALDELLFELAAAREREQTLREALERIAVSLDGENEDGNIFPAAALEAARAALAATEEQQ